MTEHGSRCALVYTRAEAVVQYMLPQGVNADIMLAGNCTASIDTASNAAPQDRGPQGWPAGDKDERDMLLRSLPCNPCLWWISNETRAGMDLCGARRDSEPD